MTLASEVEAIGGLLKKYYESGPARKQFFDDNQLSKRIYKNTRDILGGTATVGLHVGRNAGVSSAPNGGAYATPGKQTWNQTTIPLKYTYMPFRLTGPDIENSKGNAAAFANVLTANADGAIADGKREVNRQLHGDGSGILAFCSGASSTADQAILPYAQGANVSGLFPVGTEINVKDVATVVSNITTDTRAGAAAAAITAATNVLLTTAADNFATTAAGDAVGKWGAIQDIASGTTLQQHEMMGLAGLIHNTDLIGSAGWYYDLGDDGNTATASFIGPEGQSYDWSIATFVNTVQGIATASYPWWRSIVFGNTGVPRALTFSLLDRMIAKLKTERGAKTSAIYTTWQVNQKLVDLIRADRRYPDTMELDGGLKVTSYAGIPIIVDQDAWRGTMCFVDEAEFALYEKTGFSFITDSKGNNLHKLDSYDGFEVVGKVYANLGCMSRFKQGKIIDILE